MEDPEVLFASNKVKRWNLFEPASVPPLMAQTPETQDCVPEPPLMDVSNRPDVSICDLAGCDAEVIKAKGSPRDKTIHLKGKPAICLRENLTQYSF